jgi:hypothetical protein
MNTNTDKSSNELWANVAAIRLAVSKLTGARLPWEAESPIDLVNQGDRMVRCYENWLLDDEQKQMLGVRPEDKFILYASSYLRDIGLTDGQGLPRLAKDVKDDRARIIQPVTVEMVLPADPRQLAYETDKRTGTVFVAPLKFLESEGYVRLGAKANGTIYALERADGGVSVFQDGIFVTQLATLLPEGARQYIVARINLVGQDKCELSMDRNRIFWKSDQLQNIKKIIHHGLVDVANQLMSALKAQDVSVNTRNSIVNHLAIFFDFGDVDDVMYDQLPEPIRRLVEKRFRDFVRINFAHTLKKNGIAEADGYSEAWQQQVLKSFVKN